MPYFLRQQVFDIKTDQGWFAAQNTKETQHIISAQHWLHQVIIWKHNTSGLIYTAAWLWSVQRWTENAEGPTEAISYFCLCTHVFRPQVRTSCEDKLGDSPLWDVLPGSVGFCVVCLSGSSIVSLRELTRFTIPLGSFFLPVFVSLSRVLSPPHWTHTCTLFSLVLQINGRKNLREQRWEVGLFHNNPLVTWSVAVDWQYFTGMICHYCW